MFLIIGLYEYFSQHFIFFASMIIILSVIDLKRKYNIESS